MSDRREYNPNNSEWLRPVQDAQVVTAGASEITDPDSNHRPFRGIYVGTTGDVTVTLPSGKSVQFVGLAAGVIHPIAGSKITAATAVNIVVVY